MKKLSVSLIILGLFCVNTSFAEFISVDEVTCDGERISEGEELRVFYNQQESLLGIEQYDNTTAGDCRVVDFYNILITSELNINGVETTEFEPVNGAARRSTCVDGQILLFGGFPFDSASYSNEKLTLFNANNCSVLEYSLSSN